MKHGTRLLIVVGLLVILSVSALAQDVSLRFSWWGGEARHEATLAAINRYMELNPGVHIVGEYTGYDGYYQRLVTQLAGRTAPDIIQLDQPWIPDLMSQGDLFLDLQEIDMNLEAFDAGFLASQGVYDNVLVGLPTGLNAETYIVNVDFFEQHDISLDMDWTWDRILEIGGEINRNHPDQFLLTNASDQHFYMLRMYVKQHTGEQWINDDYTLGFDKDILTDAFAYFKALETEGVIVPIAERILFVATEENPQWGNGQIGFSQNWASNIEPFYQGLDLIVQRPAIMDGSLTSGIRVRPSQIIAVNKKSAHHQEAAKFVEWMFTDPEAIAILGQSRGVPPTDIGRAILEEREELDPNMADALNLALANSGDPENSITTNRELETIGEEYVHKVAYGVLTPEQAAQQMIREYEQKLQEMKDSN